MNISREKKKAEAIKRMKMMGVIDDAIKQFEKDDMIMSSEPPLGALYWVSDEEKKMIKEIEDKYDLLVYMAVKSYTEVGKMDSLLCVTDYEEEWEMDREGIKDGYVFCYVVNHDIPEFSEFGSIVIEPRFGGLVRVA